MHALYTGIRSIITVAQKYNFCYGVDAQISTLSTPKFRSRTLNFEVEPKISKSTPKFRSRTESFDTEISTSEAKLRYPNFKVEPKISESKAKLRGVSYDPRISKLLRYEVSSQTTVDFPWLITPPNGNCLY